MATTDDPPMTATYMDYAEHERTYRGFTRITKYVAIGVAVVLILMAYFLL